MAHISKSQFKARALEFFRHVEATGESVIVTDHGIPKIEVRTLPDDDAALRERLKGSVLFVKDPFEPVGDDEWEAAR
jgi:antitoxin (DNA-binding transcriptional repressor) of toxin-antitoxin stability system